jgi:hypothetical protein
MTDYKQLCAELLDAIDHFPGWIPPGKRPVINRARAVLAEPESEGPADKELAELYRKSYYECENRQGDAAQVFALRAVLARWGQ